MIESRELEIASWHRTWCVALQRNVFRVYVTRDLRSLSFTAVIEVHAEARSPRKTGTYAIVKFS